MMPSKINIDNYEAYMLDRMEGTISADDALILDKFLKNHPDLNDTMTDVDISGHIKESDDITQIFLMSEDLKKQAPSEVEIDLLIEEMEGNTDLATSKKIEDWLLEDDILQKHYSALLATRLVPDRNLIFEDKASLKRTAPVFRPVAWLAAAMLIGVLLISGALLYNHIGNDAQITPVGVELTAVTELKDKAPKMQSAIESTRDNVAASMTHDNVTNNGEIRRNAVQPVYEKSHPAYTEKGTMKQSADYREIQNYLAVNEANEKDIQSRIINLPRLAHYSSEGVASDYTTTTLYRIQNSFSERQPQPQPAIMDYAKGMYKTRKAMLNRTTETLRSFADAQLTAIEQEGLIGISPERNADGKLDGFALRIAGIEFTNDRY